MNAFQVWKFKIENALFIAEVFVKLKSLIKIFKNGFETKIYWYKSNGVY